MSASVTLITGIAGFIASNLAVTLTTRGHGVVGIGRRKPEFLPLSSARYQPADICDFDSILRMFDEIRPDTVYHLAAQSLLTTGGDEGARSVFQANVTGTTNILEAARRAGTRVVVVASSDKQYGATTAPPYDDDDTTGFVNGGLYELSKAQQDQVARLYAGLYATPAVRIARLVNIYGPGDTNYSRIIPGTIRRSLSGERPRLTAGPAGAALREYLFVQDAISSLLALAEDAERVGNIPYRTASGALATVGFNLASPHRHTAGEVIHTVQAVLRETFGLETAEPEVLPGPVGIREPGHQFNSPEKLKGLLPDWQPQSLQDGLRQTVPWYLENLPCQR